MPASRLAYLWAKRTNAGNNPCLSSVSMMCLWDAVRREDRHNKKYGLELQRHDITSIRLFSGMTSLTMKKER